MGSLHEKKFIIKSERKKKRKPEEKWKLKKKTTKNGYGRGWKIKKK